jgi:transcriptional regulator
MASRDEMIENAMYIPPTFNEDNLDTQHAFIRVHPLGLLVSLGPDNLLAATALPLLLTTTVIGPPPAPLGLLHGHLSRANTQWHGLDGQDVLVVFQGVQSYITPTWYPSKTEHGKVVPTWNYTMVQARGSIRVIEDRDWIREHVTALTHQHEHTRPEPWAVSDAPDDYVESQTKGIVGIEIRMRTIEGKWKVSQNRPMDDRRSVANGLHVEGQEEMSELVRRYGKVTD